LFANDDTACASISGTGLKIMKLYQIYLYSAYFEWCLTCAFF